MALRDLFGKKSRIPKCVCGRNLVKTTPSAFPTGKICDGCYKDCDPNEPIYNCPTITGQVAQHPHGYDLCAKCAKAQYKPSSNTTSFVTLQNDGYSYTESITALELVDGDIEKAKKLLQKFTLKSTKHKDDYKAKYEHEHEHNLSLQSQLSTTIVM